MYRVGPDGASVQGPPDRVEGPEAGWVNKFCHSTAEPVRCQYSADGGQLSEGVQARVEWAWWR